MIENFTVSLPSLSTVIWSLTKNRLNALQKDRRELFDRQSILEKLEEVNESTCSISVDLTRIPTPDSAELSADIMAQVVGITQDQRGHGLHIWLKFDRESLDIKTHFLRKEDKQQFMQIAQSELCIVHYPFLATAPVDLDISFIQYGPIEAEISPLAKNEPLLPHPAVVLVSSELPLISAL